MFCFMLLDMDTYSECIDEMSKAWEDNYFPETTMLVSSTAGGNI